MRTAATTGRESKSRYHIFQPAWLMRCHGRQPAIRFRSMVDKVVAGVGGARVTIVFVLGRARSGRVDIRTRRDEHHQPAAHRDGTSHRDQARCQWCNAGGACCRATYTVCAAAPGALTTANSPQKGGDAGNFLPLLRLCSILLSLMGQAQHTSTWRKPW